MKLEFAKKSIIQSQLQFMCGSILYESDVINVRAVVSSDSPNPFATTAK